MILFINCFLTDQRSYFEDRGLYPREDCVDTFKYMLASLAVIPWTKVYIYCLLDENYKHRRLELNDFIFSAFGPTAVSHHYRNGQQRQWREVVDEICSLEDNLVWFLNNHDHIFMDSQLDYLKRLTLALENKIAAGEKLVSCYFTHHPEMLLNWSGAWQFMNYQGNSPLEITKEYFSIRWLNNDSVQLISTAILRNWWFDYDYGEQIFHRTDGNVKSNHALCLIPFREIVRHYDGYTRWNWCDMNKITPLTIPPGFWEGRIKIQYCGKEPKPGYVHINPLVEKYACCDPQGVHYKWLLEDIPLFWRKRIELIEIEEKIDPTILLQARNEAIWQAANADNHAPSGCKIPSRDLFEEAFRVYT